MLRVEELVRSGLAPVSMEVPDGVCVAVRGRSGAGKTTLMRAIVGTQIADSGTVTALGSPAGSAPLRRTVGYVTQAPSVYRDLTGR